MVSICDFLVKCEVEVEIMIVQVVLWMFVVGMIKDKMLWLKNGGEGHRIYTGIEVLCS